MISSASSSPAMPIAAKPALPQPSSGITPRITPASAMVTVRVTPTTIQSPAASGGDFTTVVLSAVVFAALVTGIVNTVLARRSTRLEERARVRTTLAEAYQAYAAYKEFPYAIRRRRADQPAEERIRLSESLREVQARISYYQAWTQAESPETGAAYNDLVAQVRRIAGGAMQKAWQDPPLDSDQGMNIGPDLVDLSALRPAEQAFINAATSHVTALISPWRRLAFRTGR
ncbi:conserved hypothetical protein [Frankia sp. Hr75.2]|nr:conserved hypothetical protein [Frankia sp. Hr75.2]